MAQINYERLLQD